MPTYTPVTARTIRTRLDYRQDLATMMRDPGPSFKIWTGDAYNMALDEALALVHEYFPPYRTQLIAAGQTLEYQLVQDCEAVVAVEAAVNSLGGNQDPPLLVPVGFSTRRRHYLVGATPGTEDLSRLTLVLDEWPDQDVTLYVTYRAAQQLWGNWGATGSGVDTATSQDLNPSTLGVGRDLQLFWAAARVSCLRWAMQLLPGDGGREFGKEYELAKEALDDLLVPLQAPGTLRLRSSYFG